MRRDPQALEAALAALDSEHLKRRRRTIDSFAQKGSRIEVLVDGQRLIDFCGNDYLGLAHHPEIAAALSDAATRCGTGSGAAHLVTGHGIEHARLEEKVAEYTGRERALLFSTGYMANLAAVTALAGTRRPRSPRPVEPRLDHRWRAAIGRPLQAVSPSRCRISRRGAAASRDCRSRHPAGDRWRLQHGRRSGAAARSGKSLPRASGLAGGR